MANLTSLTSDDAARARYDRASGHGIVLSGDRSAEFRRARWHSIVIKVLRWGMPLSSLGLAGLYVSTMLQTAGWGQKQPPPSIVATVDKDVAMDNPRYEGFNKDGGTYVVTAKTAIPDLKNPSLVKLNAITGESYDARKSRTDLTAASGLFDSKANQLDLAGGITVVTQTGMRAQLQTATMMTKEGTLVSKTPVMVEMAAGVITSNEMTLNQRSRDVTFIEAVVAHLVPQAKPDLAAKPRETSAFGQSNAPVDVTSNRLEVHDSAKTAQFSGAVRAVQGIAQLESAVLDVSYEGGNAGAPGPAGSADPAAPATRIKRIVAPGAVVLTQGTGDRVTGNSADFDTQAETAVVTGNVVMTSGVDKRATAERAEFQQKTDSIVLSGNVVVNSGRNELRGRRLFVDRRSGKTSLTSEAEGALAKSRIFARLYQGDGQPGKPSAPKKTIEEEAAVAPAAATGFATFKTDPNAPVDIEADRLGVDDGRKLAVFTGDVKAVQGDFVIRTIELHASYSGEAGLASISAKPAVVGPAGAAGVTAKAPGQLTKIEAKGRVIVTSKQNQQVTGDWAIFDTKANTCVVGGREVILTQDKNIVRGNKLSIDMATGQSLMVTETQTAAGTPGIPVKTTGRSSVVFYPQERQKGTIALPKPVAPAKPSSSSWESATEPNRSPN